MRKILITGANGFIGREVCKKILAEGWQARAAMRSTKQTDKLQASIEAVQIGSIGPDTNWSKALAGVDCVVHLAARVHLMRNTAYDPLELFRQVNVLGTEHLAREAGLANVRRFIYMSSVKVNGEGRSTPYNKEDLEEPQDEYSISKFEAEKILHKVSNETGMEVVILRSPLVYGPGVKANFLRLLKAVDGGVPLPLASVSNRRSLIYLGNLVDAIVTCINHPRAAGNTYLISDGEDVSTPELIRRISFALGRPSRLFPFPPVLLKMAGNITGKPVAMDSLLRSLTVDCSKIRRELDWQAPFSMEQGLKETAKWYIKKKENRGQRSVVQN